MNCAEFEQLIDAHLDGELSGTLRLEFDAHRLRCRRCQLTMVMMESVGSVVASDRDVPALSDDFTDRVMGEIRERNPRTLRLRPTRVALVSGALLQAAAVLYLAVILPGMNTSDEGINLPSAAPSVMLAEGKLDPADLGAAFRDADRKALLHETTYEYIVGRMAAAGENVAAELGQMARYPLALSVPDDMARASQSLEQANPWDGFLRAMFPRELEEAESPATVPGEHSL